MVYFWTIIIENNRTMLQVYEMMITTPTIAVHLWEKHLGYL
jgi:hypothetical protein